MSNYSNIADTKIIKVYEQINNLSSKVYGKSVEALSHCSATDIDFKNFAEDIENIASQADVGSIVDEDGNTYWAKRLGIQLAIITTEEEILDWATKLGITLIGSTFEDKVFEIHKAQLLTKNGFNVRYTWPWLQKIIDDYVGDGNYTLSLDTQNFTLSLATPDASITWSKQVTWIVDKVLPCNIDYFLVQQSAQTFLNNILAYSSDSEYLYYLNYWCLGQTPFRKLQTFIEKDGTFDLNEDKIAACLRNAISYAKWNNTYLCEIENEAYDAVANTITISLRITFNLANEDCTKIAIYASDDTKLAESDVFIPFSNTHSTVKFQWVFALEGV